MNTSLSLLERCYEFIDQNGSFVDESENLLKDLEAAIAEQKDPISHYARGFTDAMHKVEQEKPQDPAFYLCPQHLAQLKLCDTLLCELSTVKMEGATACYTRPQALEPMSEEEMDKIWNDYCDPYSTVKAEASTLLFRAIEAHHGIK